MTGSRVLGELRYTLTYRQHVSHHSTQLIEGNPPSDNATRKVRNILHPNSGEVVFEHNTKRYIIVVTSIIPNAQFVREVCTSGVYVGSVHRECTSGVYVGRVLRECTSGVSRKLTLYSLKMATRASRDQNTREYRARLIKLYKQIIHNPKDAVTQNSRR